MDKALKEKWVAALRLGEFKQGTFNFERDGKHCCLGVLCVVSGVSTHADDNSGVGNWRHVNRVLAGLDPMSLAHMNDNGASFSKIADYIETNIEAE